MKQYIALGDSLTAQEGYVDFLNDHYRLDILNLSVGAGSNYLVFHRLRNCLFNNQVGPETTLIWQISGLQRYHEIKDAEISKSFCQGTPPGGSFNWFPVSLDMYNVEKVALLSNSPYFRHRDLPDFESCVQDLVSEIFLWSCFVKRIILFTGWTSSFDHESMIRLTEFLSQKNNIHIIKSEHSIVDWCRCQNLPFQDDAHPTKEGYIRWCKEILVPQLGID